MTRNRTILAHLAILAVGAGGGFIISIAADGTLEFRVSFAKA